jgi:hypothetical protein
MSHQGGHTHAQDKIEPWIPLKYIVDPCQITIKSSHEQYIVELHLEIEQGLDRMFRMAGYVDKRHFAEGMT